MDHRHPARLQCRPVPPVRGPRAPGQGVPVCRAAGHLPKEPSTVFYIGSNVPDDLTAVRRHLLTALPARPLPVNTSTARRLTWREVRRTPSCSSTTLAARVRLRRYALKAGSMGSLNAWGCAALWNTPSRAVTRLLPSHPALGACAGGATIRAPPCWCAYRVRLETARAFLAGTLPNRFWLVECDAEEAAKPSCTVLRLRAPPSATREVHRSEVEDIVALDIALPQRPQMGGATAAGRGRDVVPANSTTATSSAMCSTGTTS